ncbi:MAG: hydroxymethylglutaryl-CoA lyase, partial [Bdellovibrionota bacterium]
WCLVPNRRGLERAVAAGATQIAVFTAATESFAKRNIGMSIRESLQEFGAVVADARRHRMKVRGYVSTAFGCPFEGEVSAKKALRVVEKLAALGVDEISIGDTIGVATPNQVDDRIKPALKMLGESKTAVHFHDTRGGALANSLRALELGVRIFDSSAGGLGGCPFAPGATGNLATEDLVYMMERMGARTGIDLELLCETSLKMAQRMKRPIASRYVLAFRNSK